jgi:para-aminobenzoate synthetase component 1
MSPRHALIREIAPLQPEQALRAFEGLRDIAFLDSGSSPSELAHWSFLAAEPFARFDVKDGEAFWQGQKIQGDALDVLRDKFSVFSLNRTHETIPLLTGAIGFISYEMGKAFETIPAMPPSKLGELDLSFGFYDVVFAHDLVNDKSYLIASGFPELDETRRLARAEERLNFFEHRLTQSTRETKHNSPIKDWNSNFSKDTYKQAVSDVIEAILRGDIFQANLSQCFHAARPHDFDPLSFYLQLRHMSPAPFGAYLDYGDYVYASNSPERFLKIEDARRVEARPIKGTAPRSKNKDEDRAFAHALLRSEKDRAENTMIVDLLRNDLSRVAQSGSVRVPTLCGLETYANVHHLVSIVEASLKPDKDMIDVIRATFPGGSITGAPKIKAMEIIATLEKTPRGVYCGSIGYLSFDGRMDLNIAIRTATISPHEIMFSAGGGITLLSEPEAEYRETLVKAERLFKAFGSEEVK